jgi:hypothetical protein
VRCSDVTLKEQLDTAVRTASTLLSQNYLAQDRKRLIRCIELLDEATRAIEGGMWIADAPDLDTGKTVVPATSETTRGSSLIAPRPMLATQPQGEPLREAS